MKARAFAGLCALLLFVLVGCPGGDTPQGNPGPAGLTGNPVTDAPTTSSDTPTGADTQPAPPADNPQSPPADNRCTDATPVTEGTYNFDTSGATTDGPSEPACASAGDDQIGADIWYCYTAANAGTATVGLCGSAFDTRLAVYRGCACPAAGSTALVCDNDFCGAGGASQVSFATSAGESYLIRIGGSAGANGPLTGPGVITITHVAPPPPPANDACANVIAVGEGTVNFDTRSAVTDGPAEPACAGGGDSQIGADIWYCYTAGQTGNATVSLCGSSFNTKLAVYDGCACPTGSGVSLACDDDSCSAGGASELTFPAIAGQSYLIRIGGFIGADSVPAEGTGALTITNVIPPPPNDGCNQATAIAEGVHNFSTRGATTDGPSESACAGGGDSQISADIWYCYTASKTGTAVASLCGSTFDTKMAVYDGCACPAGSGAVLTCNDDFCGRGGASQVTFAVTAGQSYMLRIGGFTGNNGTATGDGVLNIAVGANDSCRDPLPVTEGSYDFDTTNATTDGGTESLCTSSNDTQISKDLWYCYTPSASGTVTFGTCGSSFDTKIAVYNGCRCPANNAAVVCDNNGCGSGTSAVQLTVTAGEQYLVRVGGAGNASGIGQLNITFEGLPDLTFSRNVNHFVATRTIASNDCAVAEGCVEPGTRRLLVFGAQTENHGDADLVLGNPANSRGIFYFDTCHGHYHMAAYADYLLITPTGQVAAGRKYGFCLRDDIRLNGAASPRFNCEVQGLQRGWADLYPDTLPCQYIDITGVPPGDYILRQIVNANGLIPESDYNNNTTDIPVQIP